MVKAGEQLQMTSLLSLVNKYILFQSVIKTIRMEDGEKLLRDYAGPQVDELGRVFEEVRGNSNIVHGEKDKHSDEKREEIVDIDPVEVLRSVTSSCWKFFKFRGTTIKPDKSKVYYNLCTSKLGRKAKIAVVT